MDALLRLIIHGLSTIDCSRIEWQHIKDIDGDLPYLDFPRTKVEHKTGYAIERKTPLLPSYVGALKRWRTFEKPNNTIFKTSQGAAYRSPILSRAFLRLGKEAACNDWRLKHLRNVGGTLGDQNGLSEMMVDRFLGHALKGTRAKYIGSVGPDYLVSLVNLIGAEFFDGEQVGK